MAGGDFYKALNRGSGALSTIWDNIINTVLGNRLKKTLQPTTKQEEPVLPDAGAVKQEQPYIPVDNSEQITPDINRSSKQPYITPESDQTGIENIQGVQTEGADQTPYIPEGQGQGEAGGKPGSDIPENKVYAPNIYIPTDKSTKTTKPTSSSGKIDIGGLKYTVGSKTPDQQANENLTNEMLNYITDTSKYGARGQPFINTALNAVYPLAYKQGEPPPPKMTGHEFTTDKDGNLLQYVYDRQKDLYYTTPVLDPAGNPVKQKLAEYDKNRIQPVVGKDGKIVLKNLQSGEEVETGYTPEEYDYKFGLDKSAEEWNQEYDMMKYNLAVSKAQNKGRDKGNGTINYTGYDTNGKPIINGVPVRIVPQKEKTGTTMVFNPQTKRMEEQDVYEDKIYYKVGNKLFSQAQIDQYITGTTDKKKGLVNKKLLEATGMTMDKDGNLVYTNPTKEEDWVDLFEKQRRNVLKGPGDPSFNQAYEWLKNPENQAYAKKLGLITE